MKSKISLFLAGIMVMGTLAGCSEINNQPQTSSGTDSVSSTSQTVTGAVSSQAGTNDNVTQLKVNAITDKLKDEDSDSSWNTSTATQITLNGTTAAVSGSGASVSGGTVSITEAGTYVVSGVLTKGQILVDAGETDTVRLVLNGTNITSDTNSAIYAASADKLIIILADGTINTITDGTAYTYADAEKEEPNAAIFSKCDLSICGTGDLTVNGNFNNGIATKDDLVIASGNITVSAINAALRGKDSVTILDGVFTLTSQAGDGIKSANDTDADKGWILIKGGTFSITAYNDGIEAATALQVDGGTFNISTGGGWPEGSLKRGSHARTNEGVVSGTNSTDGSYKGLKGGSSIVINNGTFTVSAYEDAVHSNGDVTITGGELILQSGKQSIHADNTVTVNGGTIDIQNSFEGIEGAFINLNGGKIDIFSTDDGINMNSSSGLLTIAGGDLYINAGGDGIDSNNNVVMTGGTVYIDGPTASDDEALDYQNQLNISGGTLVAVYLNGMSQASGSGSEQNSIKVYYSSTQKGGTEITLKSSDGTVIISYTPQKDYSSAIISTPDLKQGSTYALYAGDTKLCDITLSAGVTSVSDSGAAVSGGQGGWGGGGQKPGGGQGGRGPGG